MVRHPDIFPHKSTYIYICQFGIMIMVVANSILEIWECYRVSYPLSIPFNGDKNQ